MIVANNDRVNPLDFKVTDADFNSNALGGERIHRFFLPVVSDTKMILEVFKEPANVQTPFRFHVRYGDRVVGIIREVSPLFYKIIPVNKNELRINYTKGDIKHFEHHVANILALGALPSISLDSTDS